MLERTLIMIPAYRLLSFAVSALVAFPPVAKGNSFMASAKEAVAASNQRAEEFVDALVLQQVGGALMQALSQVGKLGQQAHTAQDFQRTMVDLKNQLEGFLSEPTAGPSVTEELVMEAYNQYLDLYRRAMDASWIPIQIDRNFSHIPLILAQTIDSLEGLCRQGVSDNSFELALDFSQELPKYEFEWEIMFQFGSQGGGFDGRYEASNYLGENKTRQLLFDGAKATAAVSTTLWAAKPLMVASHVLGGSSVAAAQASVASSSLGSFATTAGAVAPYAIAAVIIIAIAMDVSARAKLQKMASQRAEAEIYKFTNSRNTVWLAQAFKERCEEVIPLLSAVKEDLEFIGAHLQRPDKIESYYQNILPGLKRAHSEFLAYDAAKNSLELKTLFESNKCVPLASLMKLDANTAVESIPPCYISKGGKSAHLIGRDFHLDLNEGHIEVNETELEDDLKKFDMSGSDNPLQSEAFIKTRDHLRYRIYEMFVLHRSQVMQSLKGFMGDYLLESRQMAFERLLSLIGVYSQIRNRETTARLHREQEAFIQFLALDEKFKQLVAAAIYQTFSQEGFAEYQELARSYRVAFKPFYEQYNYIPDVRALNDSLRQLERLT